MKCKSYVQFSVSQQHCLVVQILFVFMLEAILLVLNPPSLSSFIFPHHTEMLNPQNKKRICYLVFFCVCFKIKTLKKNKTENKNKIKTYFLE